MSSRDVKKNHICPPLSHWVNSDYGDTLKKPPSILCWFFFETCGYVYVLETSSFCFGAGVSFSR